MTARFVLECVNVFLFLWRSETACLWHSGLRMTHCVIRRMINGWVWSDGGMIIERRKLKNWDRDVFHCHSVHHKTRLIPLRLNSGLRCKKPMANGLSCRTVCVIMPFFVKRWPNRSDYSVCTCWGNCGLSTYWRPLYRQIMMGIVMWRSQGHYTLSLIDFRFWHTCVKLKNKPTRAVFLNRRAASRYRPLASIIPDREKFSWNLSF